MPIINHSSRSGFLFRLWPTAITVLIVALCVDLGVWQLQRLDTKERIINTIIREAHDRPIEIAQAIKKKNPDFRMIKMRGEFQHEHELYFNAISLQGEGGYNILTPFRLEDGDYILVNRGWVPYDMKKPSTRERGQVEGDIQVRGVLRVPRPRASQPDNNPAKNDWYWMDLKAMAKAADMQESLPYYVEADGAANPGGYPVGGQTRLDMPNNHFMYAVTWFSLAFVCFVIYLVYSYQTSIKE